MPKKPVIFVVLVAATVFSGWIYSWADLPKVASVKNEPLISQLDSLKKILEGEDYVNLEPLLSSVFIEYADEPFAQKLFSDQFCPWIDSQDEAKKDALKKALRHAADPVEAEFLKRLPKIFPTMKGEFHPSNRFYLFLEAMNHFYQCSTVSRLTLHRNPAPLDHEVFVFSVGRSKLRGNWAQNHLLGVDLFAEILTKPETIEIEAGKEAFLLDISPKENLTQVQARDWAEKLAKSQEHVDYQKLCQDGKLVSLYAFGESKNGGEIKRDFKQLQASLITTPWDSNSPEVTLNANLKSVFLQELSRSDLVIKDAHYAGEAAAFHMVAQGTVWRYQRRLPNDSGLLKTCRKYYPGLSEMQEEVILLEPPDESKGESKVANVTYEEFCRALAVGAVCQNGNGGSCIYEDTSCYSSSNAVPLYMESISINSCGGRVCLSLFHSSGQQSTGLMGPDLGFEFVMLQALREGMDFDSMLAQWKVGSLVVTPGLGALDRQRRIYDEVVQRLSGQGSGIGWITLRPSPLLRTIRQDTAGLTQIQVLADGETLATGDLSGNVVLWDIESGKMLQKFREHRGMIQSMAEASSGGYLFAASVDGRFTFSNDDFVEGPVYRSGGVQRSVELGAWKLGSGRYTRLMGLGNSISDLIYAEDRNLLFATSQGQSIGVWDLSNLNSSSVIQPIRRLIGHQGVVEALALTQDHKKIISGSSDHSIRIWDIQEGKLIFQFPEDAGNVSKMKLASDGRTLVSISDDRVLRVWDLESRTLKHKLEGHIKDIYTFDLSPDGKKGVTGSEDKTIRVWDLKTGAQLRVLEGHAGAVKSVFISSDGKRIYSGSYDGSIKVWDLETGWLLQTLRGHESLIIGLALTPDGKKLISASLDRTIRVWSLNEAFDQVQQF